MGIDDEIEALVKQDKFAVLTESAITAHMRAIAIRAAVPILNSFLPEGSRIPDAVVATMNGAVQYTYSLWESRARLFSHSLGDQLRKKLEKAERGEFKVTADHLEYMRGQFMPVLLEASRKAQEATTESKIRRLAAILANGLEEAAPADTVAEMLRIAIDLSDADVEFLRQMNRSERFRPGGPGLASVDDANDEWKEIKPHIEGLDRSDGQSIALKLQSYGLIESVERRPTKVGPQMTPYRLLRHGGDFIRFVQEY